MKIDRNTLKARILKFSDALNAGEFELHSGFRYKSEDILAGRLTFLSHGGIFDVDFSNIDFTGPEVPNQEWRAQLNRFLWLGLCLAEDQNGDDRFSRIAVDSVNSFFSFREGLDIPDKEFLWKHLGDNTLSISVRLGKRYGLGWWGTLPFMRETIVTDEFLEKVHESTVEQIEFMIEHMTSCGNWRISQLSCLIFMGYIFRNETWLKIAVNGLNETFHTQVAEDGCHEEHTMGYHTWMAKEFSSYFHLSREMPELGLVIDRKKLIKMWEYIIIASCPDGQSAGLNDDKRWGYVNIDKLKPRLEHAVATRKNLIERFSKDSTGDISGESRYFESSGQWFVKHSDGDAHFLIFDATAYGGGHCHMAHNSVNYYYGNKMLLLDPGTFNYERSDPFCMYGRETASHNTVSVDGLAQRRSSLDESISDIRGKCVFIHNAFTGGYTSGSDGISGIHERMVLWYKGEICLINDTLDSDGDRFHANFNFLPSECEFDGRSYSTGFSDYNLMVRPIYSNTELEVSKYEGSMNPMAGWLAKDGYSLRGAEAGSAMRVSGELCGHDHGTVVAYAMVPFKGKDKPEAVMLNEEELVGDFDQDIRCRIYNKPTIYRIGANGKVYEVVSAYLKYRNSRLHPPIGLTGPYDSDGKLAFVAFDGGEPSFAYLYDGTYLKYKGRMLIGEKHFGNYEKDF